MSIGIGMGQMGGSVSPIKDEDYTTDINYLVRNIKESVDMVGLTPEIKELLEEVDSIKYKLEVKTTELAILEAIAMESTDENVAELREQLFTLVKLLYSDKIVELSTNFIRNRPGMLSYDMDSGGETKPEREITRGSILNRISNFFEKRRKHKKAIKYLNETNSMDESCGDSAG